MTRRGLHNGRGCHNIAISSSPKKHSEENREALRGRYWGEGGVFYCSLGLRGCVRGKKKPGDLKGEMCSGAKKSLTAAEIT